MNRHKSRMALLRLVLGATMISFSGVWVKVSHVTPTVSAFYRVFFGGLFLLSAAMLRNERKLRGRRQLLLGLLCGLFFSLDLVCYHYSIHYIGPGLGTMLPNLQVFILAVVGALFFKEKLRIIALLSMPVAFAGLFLIVGFDWNRLGDLYKIGVYFGLAAAVFYSVFLLSLRRLQSQQGGLSIFSVLTMVSLTTAVFLAMEVVRQGDSFKIPDMQSFWSLVALGLFSQSAGWILIANALPLVRTSMAGLVLLMQPSLAFVWDVLFFQRPTSMLNWTGVVIVLGAIYLGTSAPAPDKQSASPRSS